jgi:hypothetical protein
MPSRERAPATRGFSKVGKSRGKRNVFGPFAGGRAANLPQELVPIVLPRTGRRAARRGVGARLKLPSDLPHS